uniref:NADH dehydrogenase subunit 5 n=1 Tax=Marcia recens TaxID=2490373 RepID=UPI0022390FD2|nr:NADH dehydrogenase subunit 5 [Marcia recens]UYR95117.1 NADH dehydrogenase subunit 5 [Marcia recens]
MWAPHKKKVFNLCVKNSAAMYFFFLFFFMSLSLKASLMDGVALVMEWEISEKFFSEMSILMVIDWVGCFFIMGVLFISGCVSLFSGFYMSHEKFLSRFTHLIQAFVMSMVILVLFPGYLGLMVGWDGLGVVSFLLVIYYMNSESLSAGMITAISNRIGDVCFILAIGIFSSLLSYSAKSGLVFDSIALGILVLLGSMTKSAQVPFSAWLPEAMAAPTPVSTLVHSSTLVTAGVYVLIRFMDYLGEFEKSALMVASMVTIILAGSSGSLEVDMKKVVALSTLSQVGMMMFSLSMGSNEVAFFHLLVHAFFKALMFMCVGGVIFYSGGCQDARFLGGIWGKLPLTSSLLVFSNLSLMGFPFLSGFYSKELIVGNFLGGQYSLVSFVLLFVSLGFTVCYAVRMMSLMLQDMGLSSLSHYKMESGFYILALMMMGNGAVGMAVLMQCYFSSFVMSNSMRGDVFYSFLGMAMFFMTNCILLLLVSEKWKYSSLLKSFLSLMWFLKPLSGNLVSSSSLMKLSHYVKHVEMGWIRGFVWYSGLKKVVLGGSNKLRTMNFTSLGFILFYCVCFLAVVFLI